MNESSREAIFARSLKAAAAAAAGSSVAGPVSHKLEDGERLAKIERLRRQISAGEYDTNATELSRRLVDDHLAS